jgi:hypothetical protein
VDGCAQAVGELARLSEHGARPAELGRLEITVTPPNGAVSPNEVMRYADLGVDRLVVMRDFGDMGGQPSPEGATAVITAMERVAGDLSLSPR